MTEKRIDTLYGDESGRWLLLSGPVGWLPQSSLQMTRRDGERTLARLGMPRTVLSEVYEEHPPHPLRTAALAELLDVTATDIRAYLAVVVAPDLSDEGWSNLVKARFDRTLLAGVIDRAILNAEEAHGG